MLGFAGESPAQGDHAGDRAALVALYNATDGPHWRNNANWNSSAPLGTWWGVTTDPGGRVTRLHLLGNDLRGPIPPELGNLTESTTLYLRDNHLAGPIPAELGNLTNLTDLVLYGNRLTGPIPTELRGMASLARLDLAHNDLTGPIPRELGAMTSLAELHLGHNLLAGSIPAELGNLTNLTSLSLGSNGLTGSIPAALGNLTDLGALFLDHNGLTGAIPPELGNLTGLTTLDLQFNDFTGSFPAASLDLTSLVALRLNNNGFTGPIPAALGNLTNLETLYLHFNSFAGPVPAALGNLTRLLDLDLSRNLLAGELPRAFTNLTRLSSFFGRFFMDHNDGLCAPADPGFQAWLGGIPEFRGDTCGNVATLPRRPFTVTAAPASIPAGVTAPAAFEVRWGSTAERVPRDELRFEVYPSACLSWQAALAPPWIEENWHATSDGLGYEYRNEFRHTPVPAADISCVLEVTEVRGARGTTTLTISSTARVPDLSVREPLTVSNDRPDAGQGLTLSATIENLGTASAAPTTLRYYLSYGDSYLDPDDSAIAAVSIEPLAAAASDDSALEVAAPFAEGAWFYVACADSVHGEVYADNNCAASGVVRVTGTLPPDLVVVAPAASHSQV